ncbi:MAG TPA: acetyl-CoA carboxylase biotin carboxylase subunit [Spirochaetia bacterium]|nr:acetyl-CoA carboxylase biotin carboxylase subunit [Spirochaetia bacterium]
MIKSLLIANRGEIAVRIIRTCREMGISPVAVYSEADRHALHVQMADSAVCVGPPSSRDSYLNMSNLISAAILKGCDAIHPGVGFLAENSAFARLVEHAGLIFIGPSPDVIDLLGDKVKAKETARKNHVPCIPGTDKAVDRESALGEAESIGLPVIIKAAAGGGGKGMRIVRNKENLADALRVASHEAEMAFSDGRVYLERYLENPRHVEIQLLGDEHGNVIHLGERDCTVQQNHQKLVEESPSPVVTPEMRKKMGRDAVRLFKDLGYRGAGTIEFLVADNKYYFMEVNARVQVEHTVSEMVTGIDIIREQIRTCTGEALAYSQADVELKGYAIECRINAIAPGRVEEFLPPGGYRVRVDSLLTQGYLVPPFYDALVAKVLASGEDREDGIRRMSRALSEMRVVGFPVNIELQKRIIGNSTFKKGQFGTGFLEQLLKEDAK